MDLFKMAACLRTVGLFLIAMCTSVLLLSQQDYAFCEAYADLPANSSLIVPQKVLPIVFPTVSCMATVSRFGWVFNSGMEAGGLMIMVSCMMLPPDPMFMLMHARCDCMDLSIVVIHAIAPVALGFMSVGAVTLGHWETPVPAMWGEDGMETTPPELRGNVENQRMNNLGWHMLGVNKVFSVGLSFFAVFAIMSVRMGVNSFRWSRGLERVGALCFATFGFFVIWAIRELAHDLYDLQPANHREFFGQDDSVRKAKASNAVKLFAADLCLGLYAWVAAVFLVLASLVFTSVRRRFDDKLVGIFHVTIMVSSAVLILAIAIAIHRSDSAMQSRTGQRCHCTGATHFHCTAQLQGHQVILFE